MDATQLESLFFRPPAMSAAERNQRKRHSSDRYRAPGIDRTRTPYHLDLAAVLPARTAAVREAGQLVFHAVGDTGGVNGTGAQINVADHMARQVHETPMPDQPSFLFHLGDVVYDHGEDSGYHDQFYHPYKDYPAPIFAIPGNHDGDTLDPSDTLVPFRKHFCAAEASHAPEAGHSQRPTQIQPNPYWRLKTPLATIVGLYSNVSGELDKTDQGGTEQRDWLTEELKTVPADRCLILAVHHPLYSSGKHGGTARVRDAIEHAIEVSGRVPDLFLTGHDHCYQRFTRRRDDRRIPVLVVGAGGFAGYDDLARVRDDIEPLPGIKLEAFEDKHPGFLRLSVSCAAVTGEYFTVPKPGREHRPEKLRDSFTLDLRTHRVS
jgi:hypothetical protein